MSDLIDRQALRAAHGLGADCHDCKRDMKSCQYDRDYSLMDFCEWLDDAPAASPWHRVEDPPKEYGNYLAVVNGEVMEVTYSDISMRDDWNWSTCDAEGFVWIRSESVTHWMPLPEPPKEETK